VGRLSYLIGKRKTRKFISTQLLRKFVRDRAVGDAPTSFIMSNLKRKDAPGGNPPAKLAKNTKEARTTTKENAGKDAKPAPKKSAEVPEKAPVVSLLKDEGAMMPRGGASILTPLEHKKIQLEAKADAMRDEEFNTGGKVLQKKKRKTALKGDKKTDKKTGEEEQAVRVESLSFKVGSEFDSKLASVTNMV
jgi:rRNA biogenesis protein RRP5